jgi:hypothetical protein
MPCIYLIPIHSSTGKVAQLQFGKRNVGPFLSWAYTGAFRTLGEWLPLPPNGRMPVAWPFDFEFALRSLRCLERYLSRWAICE